MSCKRPAFPRSAFTLVEVLVSVPLMVLVFWIIGQIFTTTRDTVSLGMTHAKVTASAESAVQRIARDLTGLRPDGRLVITGYRVTTRALNRQDREIDKSFPGAYGNLAFIAQQTAVSQTTTAVVNAPRGNLVRIHYRQADRRDNAGNVLPFWNNQALMREQLLYVYNQTLPPRLPNQPEIGQLVPNTVDTIGFPSTLITVSGSNVLQPRTDLLQQAVNSFRLPVLADNVTPRPENRNPPFGVSAGSQAGGVFPFVNVGGVIPALAPSPVLSADFTIQRFYQQLMLANSGLAYTGRVVPPAGAGGLPANRYPAGILANDPDASRPDPGAAALFQWWGQDLGAAIDNWNPNHTQLPEAAGPTSNFYLRRFMFIRTPEDQAEYLRSGPYANIPLSTGGQNPNRAPNAPNLGERIPWPEAIRANLMIFDRVGRFREGALFQAVVDIPGGR